MLIIAYPRKPDFLALTPFIKRDPQLVVIDRLLQDRKLILGVANDLALSAPQALWNGRPATPVVATLRVAVARRLKNWSYHTAEKEINGSMQWRWFCALDAEPCPDFSTLRDREALIRPPTLHRLNDRVACLAQREGVTQGHKLRADGSVTETHIHYPTDSSLLADSVRVLGRTLAAARRLLKPRTAADKRMFRDSHRQAKHLARQIAQRLRGTKGQKTLENKAHKLYRRLVQLTEESVDHAWDIVLRLKKHATLVAWVLVATLEHYLPLVCQVINQTTRRVFQHEAVPASDKIVSLFELHTAIIQRGKARPKETEFGRRVWYCESDGGDHHGLSVVAGQSPRSELLVAQSQASAQIVWTSAEDRDGGSRRVFARERTNGERPGRETRRVAETRCQESRAETL